MLPFAVFFVAVMIALAVIGTTVSGMFVLTVVAGVCLGLTVLVGIWTLTRRNEHL